MLGWSQESTHRPKPHHQPRRAPNRTPTTPETFEQRRSRIDRSETISYGPREPTTPARPQPYGPTTEHGFLVDVLEPETTDDLTDTGLPSGWYADEYGYLALEPVHDTWELKGNTLIRNHYVARHSLFPRRCWRRTERPDEENTAIKIGGRIPPPPVLINTGRARLRSRSWHATDEMHNKPSM